MQTCVLFRRLFRHVDTVMFPAKCSCPGGAGGCSVLLAQVHATDECTGFSAGYGNLCLGRAWSPPSAMLFRWYVKLNIGPITKESSTRAKPIVLAKGLLPPILLPPVICILKAGNQTFHFETLNTCTETAGALKTRTLGFIILVTTTVSCLCFNTCLTEGLPHLPALRGQKKPAFSISFQVLQSLPSAVLVLSKTVSCGVT